MDIYINGSLRSDIEVLLNSSFEQNENHKTSSRMSVKYPSGSTDILECDYIRVVNDGVIIHAGTILSVEQRVLGYSKNIGYKVVDLNITSNADFIASVFVDLVFPNGSSIANVLFGNHSTGDYSQYYNSDLDKEFSGIFEKRIAPEGITITASSVDDFSMFILSEQSTLWGSRVSDVLDTLCSIAGAWWEITNDKVFNMRFDVNRDDAPFKLDANADIYDLQPTRDAYTLYSAVRVIGGRGKGSPFIDAEIVQTTTEFTEDQLYEKVRKGEFFAGNIYSKKVILNKPIHSGVGAGIATISLVENPLDPESGSSIIYRPVGIKGLHDDNTFYKYLASYGGTEIDAKEGYYIPIEDPDMLRVTVSYYPQVPITARLVDPLLVEEIKAQRGGTGIVEYTLEDDSIVDFQTATSLASNFLKTGSGRAATLTFKTRHTGLSVGQVFRNSEISLYGITGHYKITRISADVISDADIEYTVTASTSAFSDGLKSLFYRPVKTSFKLGSDIPPADGVYVKNDIAIKSSIETVFWQSPTCAELDALDRTAGDWLALDYSWRQILNAIEVIDLMGNYLTQDAKNNIAKILNGQTSTINLNANSLLRLKGSNGQFIDEGPSSNYRVGDPVLSNNAILSAYYIGEYAGDSAPIAQLVFGNSNNTVQIVEVNIDKTASNERGLFAVTITKNDEVI